MNSITFFSLLRFVQFRLHVLVILSCLGLALLGRMPESSAGWHTSPPVCYVQGMATVGRVTPGRKKRHRHRRHAVLGKRAHRVNPVVWLYVQRSWRAPWMRSALLSLAWQWHGELWAVWLVGLPWAMAVQTGGVACAALVGAST